MFHQLASNYVNNLQSSGQSDLFMLIFVTLINSIHTISVDQNGPKRDQHVNLKDHDYRHLILSSSSSSSNRHQPADIHHHNAIVVGSSKDYLPDERRFIPYSSVLTNDDNENRMKYMVNGVKKRQQYHSQLVHNNNYNLLANADRLNVKRDSALQYYNGDLLNSTSLSSDCPNITKNNRFKCAKNLDKQFCACYKQAFNRWLNLTIFDKDQSTCCSRLEVRYCVELIFRSERRECKSRWEKESKRYAELVVPGKDYLCRDYRKSEHCKQGFISITTIALIVIAGVLIIIACVGFAGYACYRKYTE